MILIILAICIAASIYVAIYLLAARTRRNYQPEPMEYQAPVETTVYTPKRKPILNLIIKDGEEL